MDRRLALGAEKEEPIRTRAERPRRALRPLAPSVYLLRNASKTIPLVGVIMLAVLLVAGIISMINSIPYSIRTIYSYSREMVGITPRGDPLQTPILLNEIRDQSPVPLGRVMLCRTIGTQVKSIVGKWPFLVVGLEQPDIRYYLDRQYVRSVTGRIPRPGEPEVIVSRPVLKNLGLQLYDPSIPAAKQPKAILLGPNRDESYSPKNVKVVGIAETDRWLMVSSIEYIRANHLPPIDVGIVFAKERKDQDRLDHWADRHFKGRRAAVLAYYQIERNTDEMFKTLYQILNVVIGTLVLVITVMMGMLINIYQSQRLVEFGLLQAIGYTKRQLLRRVVLESVMVVIGGWILGVGFAYSLLCLAKRVMMDPKAFALNPVDPIAYLYSVPLPISILIVAGATVALRFRKFDPVGVVERRLV